MSRLDRGERALFALLALPALAIVGLLLYTMLARAGYGYDLEWMEGGLLDHARRIAEREGLYAPPSAEFIPYLYTPLYPSLIALLGEAFGISYGLGRAISILATIATLALLAIAVVRDGGAQRRAAWAGGALAAGLYAATYPWVDGWYDLVRADALFVLMVLGGLVMVRRWARHPGPGGQLRVALAAYVLALAFFCKQTGVLFCAVGGAAVLVMAWRRAPIYAAVAALVGLGGTALFDRATSGWFWTFIYEIHQAHDFSKDRFVTSFGNILGHFPAMTTAIALGLVVTGYRALRQRRIPDGAAGLLFWTPVFAVACVVGALGWATQWAHFNAYMPAMATGALAAGAALPAIAGSLERDGGRRLGAVLGAALVAAGLAVEVGRSWWRPARFVPTDADHRAGDALIARLRAIDGDVFVPFHPWYAVLAGKRSHVHRMGILDVTYGNKLKVAGLREAFAARRWAAVVLDDRPVGPELAGLTASYRVEDQLPKSERPRTFSGARVSPRTVWLPDGPLALPPGARALWGFERGDLGGWTLRGAWGKRPVSGPLGDQGPVYRVGGRGYLSSYHGGDQATGVATSPRFELRGRALRLRLSGGRDEATLRAELVVDGEVVRSATGTNSERLVDVEWNVAAWSGRTAELRLVDEATGPWGHLNADEVWLIE